MLLLVPPTREVSREQASLADDRRVHLRGALTSLHLPMGAAALGRHPNVLYLPDAQETALALRLRQMGRWDPPEEWDFWIFTIQSNFF